MKANRQLVILGLVLRADVLPIKTRAELLETFLENVLYGLSTTAYRKVNDNKLKVVQNTA